MQLLREMTGLSPGKQRRVLRAIPRSSRNFTISATDCDCHCRAPAPQ
jgi:hypothetical protein